FSPDRMLQGRLFSYGDTQRYRLGVNHGAIPVNAPKCPFHNSFHRDGAMRVDGNLGSTPNYEPNRYGAFAEQPEFREPPQAVGAVADRFDHREDDDYYSQPRALFNLFDDAQKSRLFGNIAAAMHGVPDDVAERQIGHFAKIDATYAQGVIAARKALVK
ncbi:MAG: catalase, partial [Pandoraea sp.]